MKIFGKLIVITLLLSLGFYLYPAIDLTVAHWFYNSANASHQFLLSNMPAIDLLRKIIIDAIWVINAGLLAILLAKVIKPNCLQRIKAKTAVYILICFVVAPSLIVNVTLKDHWGRPRPSQISEFAGDKQFQPVWVMSRQCDHNCAFVCGDSAAVFALFAWVPLLRRKILAATVVSLAGLAVGVIRMAAGGHFLSDVILSGLIVYTVEWAIYLALYQWPIKYLSEANFEVVLQAIHYRLLRLLSFK
jgi:lipid A 4'-phosphatase